MRGVAGTLLAMSAFGTVTALAMNFVTLSIQRPVNFFWVTADPDGNNPKIACEAQVLDHALIRPNAVTAFARDAVINVNEYTYLSWDKVLPQALSAYFTPAAARVYLNEFSDSSLRRTVERNYYQSSAISTFPAVIATEDNSAPDGRRAWDVQVPATIYYQTGGSRHDPRFIRHNEVINRIYTVRVIEQEPTAKNFRGVAVVAMSSQPIQSAREFERATETLSPALREATN